MLIEQLRALGLAATEWAAAQAHTLRVKLLKIGAVILRDTRCIRVLYSHYPFQDTFRRVYLVLNPS